MATLRISLEQWRALVAVVESGSYAKAAESLHKTQSSVTYAVQKLESSLGVKAFALEGRKSRLTETGHLLYRRARTLLEDAAGVERAARSVSAGWEAEIRIAVEILFPNPTLLRALDRFGAESPHTRLEVFESVLAGTTEALVEKRVDLAISPRIPPDLVGDPVLRMRALPVAHPEHPLHRLGRPVTLRDLRHHRRLFVRESDALRATKAALDTAQRWTVSSMSMSIIAARMGFGFGWYPEEKIRDELALGLLKPLPMREGAERFVELYLIFADRENAGPGVLRLAEIVRETCATDCREGISLLESQATPGRTRSTKRRQR
jgi:DNA-binding transcriptional LysR family regulator